MQSNSSIFSDRTEKESVKTKKFGKVSHPKIFFSKLSFRLSRFGKVSFGSVVERKYGMRRHLPLKGTAAV